MSKELSEQLREIALNYDYQDNTTIHVVADGIDELERERDSWKASAENRLEIQWQREKRIAALLFDNARLRKALEKCSIQLTALGFSANHADEALAATPEQSLDALKERIRTEVMAELADRLEALHARLKSVIQIQESP